MKAQKDIFEGISSILDGQPMGKMCVWFGWQMGQVMQIDAEIEALQARKKQLLGQIRLFRDEMKKGGAKI